MITTNEQLNEMGLAPINRQAMLPAAREVKRGKGYVTVQTFTSSLSARDIKAALKGANPKMSGKELAKRVNDTLRGERDVREQLGIAWYQATVQSGYVPDKGEHGKNGAVLRFVRVKAEEPAPVVDTAVQDENAKLKAQLEELQAQLAKLTAGVK